MMLRNEPLIRRKTRVCNNQTISMYTQINSLFFFFSKLIPENICHYYYLVVSCAQQFIVQFNQFELLLLLLRIIASFRWAINLDCVQSYRHTPWICISLNLLHIFRLNDSIDWGDFCIRKSTSWKLKNEMTMMNTCWLLLVACYLCCSHLGSSQKDALVPGAWSPKFDPRFRNEEHKKVFMISIFNIGIYPAMNNYHVLRVATAHNLSNQME